MISDSWRWSSSPNKVEIVKRAFTTIVTPGPSQYPAVLLRYRSMARLRRKVGSIIHRPEANRSIYLKNLTMVKRTYSLSSAGSRLRPFLSIVCKIMKWRPKVMLSYGTIRIQWCIVRRTRSKIGTQVTRSKISHLSSRSRALRFSKARGSSLTS